MNDLLQKHGCANVFTIPEGLKELMADITREVLRDQPPKVFDYIANYLSVLLITREHGVLAVRILDDLCDCRPSVSDHLVQIGMERPEAVDLSEIIKEEIAGYEPVEGREMVKEMQILKRVLTKVTLDEETTTKVCQIIRNAYRDYWYRKKLLEKHIKVHPDEPWEIAAERTLQLYKSTKPSYTELNRATQKIQAAYRGYYVRRNLLRHLKPKKKQGPKVELPGPPIDIACSREIDLGPVINIKVREENVEEMFDEVVGDKLKLPYDPMKTLTHVENPEQPHYADVPEGDVSPGDAKATRFQSSPSLSAKSLASKSSAAKNLTSKSLTSKTLATETKSMASRIDQAINEPMDDEAYDSKARKSRVSVGSASVTEKRRSRTQSLMPGEQSQQKISFSQAPTNVINYEDEVPEDITVAGAEADGYEVPEDITGQSDLDSAPPSSAPDTDIELSTPASAAEDTGESAAEEE